MTQLRRRPEVDYYKELQIDADAEPEVIEAAYRALSKKYHPDINHAPDSEDRMARINSAYNTLSDASKRRDYNHLRLTPPPTSTVPHSRNPASAASRAHTVKTAPAASPSVRKTSPPDRPDNPRPTSSTFSPSPGGQNSPKSTGQAASSSFRPQNSPPQNSAAGPGVNRTVPSYTDEPRLPRSRRWLWLAGICVALLALLVGGVLGVETLFGNPLKTSFLIKQPAVVVIPAAPTPTRAPAGPAATSQPVTIPPTVTASRESVNAFLSNAELYAGRVSDVGLTAPDVLQLRVKLAANGIVLNSESPLPGRTADELDVLRQSEATTYNLIYTLFGRFQELNRINLILTDLQDKAAYRADVARSAAFTFYSWHSSFNYNDPAEAAKAARQDRLSMHFGVLLDESLRLRLQTPSESNLQAELQSIGLTAFAVTGGSPPSVNYAQVRSQAEIAVDFARIIYTLYTRFPALDKLQIVLFSSPDRPVKVTDRQLFNQITLESWSQAGKRV